MNKEISAKEMNEKLYELKKENEELKQCLQNIKENISKELFTYMEQDIKKLIRDEIKEIQSIGRLGW